MLLTYKLFDISTSPTISNSFDGFLPIPIFALLSITIILLLIFSISIMLLSFNSCFIFNDGPSPL